MCVCLLSQLWGSAKIVLLVGLCVMFSFATLEGSLETPSEAKFPVSAFYLLIIPVNYLLCCVSILAFQQCFTRWVYQVQNNVNIYYKHCSAELFEVEF